MWFAKEWHFVDLKLFWEIRALSAVILINNRAPSPQGMLNRKIKRK
jgi:hypothetical protein